MSGSVVETKTRIASDARTFVALDGLRGVAALMVAFRHAPFLWAVPAMPMGLMKNSYLAVDLFFVLSGFVLEHAYGRRFRAGMSITSFMSARLQRFYPLYVIAFAIALPTLFMQFAAGNVTATGMLLEAACELFMLPTPNSSYPDADLYPLNYAAWSLFFELVANFLFVAIGARLSLKLLMVIVGGFGGAMAICALNGWFGFDLGAATGVLNAGATWASSGAGVLRVGFSFFAGILIYRIFVQVNVPRVSPNVASALFVVAAAVLASGFDGPQEALLDIAVVTLLFPILILLCAAVDVGDGRFARTTEFLGLLSYGVYVLQVPTYRHLEIGATRLGLDAPWVGLAATLIVILLTYVVTVLIDIPARHWLKATANSGIR